MKTDCQLQYLAERVYFAWVTRNVHQAIGFLREFETETVGVQVCDSITQSLKEKLDQRAKTGLAKYGVSLDRGDLTEVQWLNHLQEELLDGAGYIEKLIKLKQQVKNL